MVPFLYIAFGHDAWNAVYKSMQNVYMQIHTEV